MRDKVKRFISILMTALMLVNLMPVGALADGITSIGYRPEVAASTGNHTVYVYARFDGDPLPGVTLNASQWYTIGYIANVDLPSPGGISWGKYWYYNNNNYCGSTINSTSASGIIGGLVQEYNKSIVIKSDEWISANFKACPGADTYMEGTSEPAWHLDIIVDINKNPPVHNLVFKVNNSNGKQIGTPKKVTGRWTNPLSSNKYYAGNPVPETIIDGGRIYQLKTKREGNPNLDTKIYFNEPIKNVEFYYKDMGPVKRNYTVNYYLNGTEEKVKDKDPITGTAALGETVTPDTNVSGYTLVPDQKTSLTIVDGDNVLNLYYYKNVELTANSDTVPYNGQEQEVSGFTGAPEDADFRAITVGAKGTNAGTYHANFPTGTKGTVDATGKYIVTKAINGSLTINKRSVTLTSASDSKVYDGTALTNDKVTVGGADGFADGEGAEYNVTGTQTNVGSSDNTFTYTLKKGTKADNYDIKTENGTLTVTPVTDKVTVTITGNTASEKYDGTEKTASGYGVSISNEKYTEADFEFKGNAEVKGTDANTYPMGLTAANFTNKSANFTNVEFVVTDGSLTINKRNVTLTSATDSKVYDGNALTNDKVTVGGDGFAKDEGATYDVTGSQTVVGSSENTFTYTLNGNTKAENYTIETKNGTLTVTDRVEKYVIELEGNDGNKQYDGEALTVNGFKTLTATVNGQKYTVSGLDATATKTDVNGETTFNVSGKAVVKDASDNDVTSQFEVTTKPGTLTISKRNVTLTSATDSKVYDGNALTNDKVTVGGDGFVAGEVTEIKATGSVTNVSEGEVTNTITFTKGEKFNEDNYAIEKKEGKLSISKRSVTLTSATLIKDYDGTPLTNGDAPVKEEFGTEKAFPDGEGVTYTFTGSQTNAGSSKNMFTYAWNEGTKADNYTICPIEGDLVITPIDGIKVTITGRKDTQTYDGKPHKVEGYDVKPDNPLFTEKDIEFNGEAEATGTDVRIDPYQMGLKPEQFTNTSNNFTNVEFVVEDGQIVITPRPVTLTSETAGKTYDGTALEKPVVTVGGDGFVEGQVKEIKATGSVTNAGSVANTITFTPNKETFKDGNYAITKTEGTLTIAKRSVLITSQSATKTYDGSALTRPAVTITGDGFVPGELAKAEATGSITKVGSTPNAIRYTTTGAFNAANYSIALSVGTLTVTEKPKPEPRRTFNLTINYVYQNGKRAAASYNRGGLKNGETFDITSPVIAGYTASETVVSGTIYNRDIKVTVIYTADGVNLDDYGVPLGLGNITMNVGDCFE